MNIMKPIVSLLRRENMKGKGFDREEITLLPSNLAEEIKAMTGLDGVADAKRYVIQREIMLAYQLASNKHC
ncbi:MAG: hypothetical protein QXO93_03610 [Acidilobaceae archaeon]